MHDKSIHLTINKKSYVCQCCVQLAASSKLKWKVLTFKAIHSRQMGHAAWWSHKIWIFMNLFLICNLKRKKLLCKQTSLSLIFFASFLFHSSFVSRCKHPVAKLILDKRCNAVDMQTRLFFSVVVAVQRLFYKFSHAIIGNNIHKQKCHTGRREGTE